LAAGYATRLYPLTKEYPKPLLEVKNRPIINYIIDKLNLVKEIEEIIVVTNNKFFARFKKWKSGIKSAKKLTIVNDLTKNNADRLGAIGDINFALKNRNIREDILIIGGDNLFSGSLNKFISVAKAHVPDVTIGAYKLKNLKDASKYGVVKIGKNNKIVDFKEKPKNPKSPFVAMCLYYIPHERFELVSRYMALKKRKADATGKYISWLKGKINTYSFVFKGSWYDIGDYKYLNAAKKNFA
jgi:glucose-1-phosphate thymidylyltransferase